MMRDERNPVERITELSRIEQGDRGSDAVEPEGGDDAAPPPELDRLDLTVHATELDEGE